MYLYANVGACLVLRGFFLFVVVYLCAYIIRQPFLQTTLAKRYLLDGGGIDIVGDREADYRDNWLCDRTIHKTIWVYSDIPRGALQR